MLRLAAAALAAALLAGCSEETGQSCPGEAVAALHFTGSKVARGDPSIADFDPVKETQDCEAALGYEPTIAPFDGTLSADAGNAAAALCRARGPVLYGQRTGDRYLLEVSTDGAVLGEECAPTCNAGLRLLVSGDVLWVDGDAAGFVGVLVVFALAQGLAIALVPKAKRDTSPDAKA